MIRYGFEKFLNPVSQSYIQSKDLSFCCFHINLMFECWIILISGGLEQNVHSDHQSLSPFKFTVLVIQGLVMFLNYLLFGPQIASELFQ